MASTPSSADPAPATGLTINGKPIEAKAGQTILEVVRELCAGYANCLDVAPDLFDLDDDDIAIVLVADHDDDQRDLLERAVRRCPARAIVLTHGHNDHINAAVPLRDAVDAPGDLTGQCRGRAGA